MDPPARILAVDDTPAGIRLLEAYLAPRRYTVLAARSGPAALAQVASDPPDLILLDLGVPEMSGLHVLRRPRAPAAGGWRGGGAPRPTGSGATRSAGG